MTDPLEAAPPAHRRTVALQLGLPPAASADDIRAALRDPVRIAEIVGALSSRARHLAARAGLLDEGVVEQGWN